MMIVTESTWHKYTKIPGVELALENMNTNWLQHPVTPCIVVFKGQTTLIKRKRGEEEENTSHKYVCNHVQTNLPYTTVQKQPYASPPAPPPAPTPTARLPHEERKRKLTKLEKYNLYNRQNGQCNICGKYLPKNVIELHSDHKIPLVNGGTNKFINFQIICSQCSKTKKNDMNRTHSKKKRMIKELKRTVQISNLFAANMFKAPAHHAVYIDTIEMMEI